MEMVARCVLRFTLGSLLPCVAGLGQQAPDAPRFTVRSAAVMVDVLVTDRKGNVVTGLKADEFRILENDSEQRILNMEPPAEARLAGNAVREARAASPRFVTIVMDVGDMRLAGLHAAIDAAALYAEKITAPDDFLALYVMGKSLRLVVPFTRDRKTVVEGIRSLGERAADGAFTARDLDRTEKEIQKLRQDENNESDENIRELIRAQRMTIQSEMWMASRFQARGIFLGLRAIASAAAGLPGRKNVVLFSEGFLPSSEAAADLAAVVNAANRANVAVYAVDPGGLATASATPAFDAETRSVVAAPRPGSRARQIAPNTVSQQMQEVALQGPETRGGYSKFDWAQRLGIDIQHDDLRTIADATGGLFISNRNDLRPALERIDRDLREYYTLTYQPRTDTYDGSFRKIRVTVSQPGCTVKHRKGYWAIPPGEEQKLTPAAAQVLASAASGALKAISTTKINAALLFGPKDDYRVPVSVWLPGNRSWLNKVGAGFGVGMTAVLTARDSRGRLLDVQQKSADLRFTQQDWAVLQKSGFQLTASLTVPAFEPVEVQAVLHFSNGAGATASSKLAFPADPGPRATSLLLTSRIRRAESVADRATDPLRILDYQLELPSAPEFEADEKLTVFFGVERGTADVALAIKSGGKVVRELARGDLHAYPDSSGRLFFLKQYPLAGLPPGSYRVEAVLRGPTGQTVQSAGFSVRQP